MALNVKNENTALNTKQKIDMMALNVELRTNDGFECQNWEYDSERLTKKKHDGSKCRKGGDECSIVIEWQLWMSNCEGIVTLNEKLEIWLWTPNWKHGSERWTEKNDFERQTRTMALNAKLQRDGDSERQTKSNGYERQA